MCWFKFKKKKKPIEVLTEKVDELTKLIKTQELERLRNKSLRFDNFLEQSSHVAIKVKNARVFQDANTGEDFVRIDYEVEPVNIHLDENGDIIKNERFIAMNLLNLVSIDDMEKIQKALDSLKK